MTFRFARSCGLLFFLTLLSAEREASAKDGFAVNRFEPAERGSSWFVLDSLDIKGNARPAAGLTLDYQYRPLAIYDDAGEVRSAIVGHVVTTHLGANITMWNRLRAGFNLPLVLYTEGEGGTLRGVTYDRPKNEQAIGDLRFGVDARLFGEARDVITAAFGARLWLPTGDAASYTGDGGVRVGPRLSAAGTVADSFVYGASFGVAFRNPKVSTFADSPINHDFIFALSAGVKLADGKVTVGPELYGTTTLDGAAFKTRSSPLEILLGGHMALGNGGLRAGLGVGTGLVAGFGAPAARLLGSIEWAQEVGPDEDGDGILDSEDACRSEKGVRSADPARNGCPVNKQDTDGDGIPDTEDACMDVFGKRTNDKRTNGCDDRDRDGIMDPLDACPNEQGPPSSDPNKNGCPERKVGDKDGDGIPDDVDACPDVVGNKSDDPDLNGCPDPDPDKDGITTDVDACPDVPGKPDPDPTKNGCPAAFIQGNQIRIRDQVKFKTASAEILPGKESEEVLKAVFDLLNAHPEIAKVRVEGHTDNQGVAAANKKLSENRAASVVKWLTSKGIDKGRLTSAGFGQERPLDSNDTEKGRATNRRVELHIESQGDKTPAP